MADVEPSLEMICPQCGERRAGGIKFCPSDGALLHAVAGGVPVTAGASPGGMARRPGGSLVGTVLADRYRLVRKIGEGGMGEVYEAQHVYIDRRFAVKTLRREILGNPEAALRFQQEARAASTIGHENIVDVEDFGQLPDGGVYMAMELLEGTSLAERTRSAGGSLPRGEILDILIQMCRGLGAAHDKGIIHRDMKPENVFLTRRSGRLVVKILDFGIAKVTSSGGGSSSQPQLTQTGAVFGTPFYMSPEQALGKPLDARTDVYSVGVMLYELVAGRVPFEGDSFMAILSQHITTQPLPPSRLAPAERPVPLPLERVILKAMAKEREQRYPSMQALGEALLEAERRSVAETLEGLGPEAPAVELAELPHNRAAAHASEDDALPGDLVPASSSPSRARLALYAVLGAAVVLGATFATRTALRSGGEAGGAAVSSSTAADPLRPPAAVLAGAGGGGTAEPGSAGDGVATVDVVLDTNPGGAKVFAEGRLIAETPDAIKVPAGRTLEVLIHKDGYTPRQLTIDPARDGRKVIVRLERDKGRAPRAEADPTPGRPLPSLPPQPAPMPTMAPPPSPTPPPPRAENPVVLPPPATSTRPSHAPRTTPGTELYAPMPPPPPRRPPPPRSTPVPAPLDPYAN